MVARYEKYRRGKHVWQIAVERAQVLERSPGSRSVTRCASPSAARAQYEKRRRARLAEGYVLDGSPIYGDAPVVQRRSTTRAAVRVLATETTLRRFEKAFGASLPADYRVFASTVGGGGDAVVRVFVPTKQPHAFDLRRLQKTWSAVREVQVETYGEKHRAFFDRAIAFADSLSGDLYLWDPSERSDWPVVLLPRGSSKVVRLRGGFRSFLARKKREDDRS